MKAFFLFIFLILFTSACTEVISQDNRTEIYTLDVSNIHRGTANTSESRPLIVSHNSYVLLPIDLSTKEKIIETEANDTLRTGLAKVVCRMLYEGEDLRKWGGRTNITVKDTADITILSLEMVGMQIHTDYPERYDTLPLAESFCVGVHTREGWAWTDSIKPQNPPQHVGDIYTANVTLTAHDVDQIALFFDNGGMIQKIRYGVVSAD